MPGKIMSECQLQCLAKRKSNSGRTMSSDWGLAAPTTTTAAVLAQCVLAADAAAAPRAYTRRVRG